MISGAEHGAMVNVDPQYRSTEKDAGEFGRCDDVFPDS
jgi:hypothetical protein